jgi:Flp pilus assembly pilin Flp
MKLFDHLKNFAADESGAVTVDWVVLTASVVFLALAVIAIISPSVNGLSSRIAGQLDAVETGPGSATP